MISNLPRDLLEDVLCRLPLASLRAVRSTCKSLNDSSSDVSVTKKLFGKGIAAKENEFLVVLTMGFKVYLLSVNPHGSHIDGDNVESFIKRKAKLVSLKHSDVADIVEVFHCEGLLLCIIIENNNHRLVVWNPNCAQTRSIEPRKYFSVCDRYALGYEKNKNDSLCYHHKILRFNNKFGRVRPSMYEFEIYNFDTDSWKVIDVTHDWDILFFQHGVTLKGNTYWFAREMYRGRRQKREIPDFLICFDFTRERFGPRLSLPFHSYPEEDTVTLSSVREEQLAVLFQRQESSRIEVWITYKIEPLKVSWNKLFLGFVMRQITPFRLKIGAGSFFVEENKKVVVVIGDDGNNTSRHRAYIIGKDGYLKQIDFGKPTHDKNWCPLVCSYVPSLVQIKQPSRVTQQQQQHHDSILPRKKSWLCFR